MWATPLEGGSVTILQVLNTCSYVRPLSGPQNNQLNAGRAVIGGVAVTLDHPFAKGDADANVLCAVASQGTSFS